MATDAELLALIGRTPSPQTTTTAEELLPDLDWSWFLSPGAQQEIQAATSPQNPFQVTTEQILEVVAPPPQAWDPVATLIAGTAPTVDNPFADFSFSFQEDGSADEIFASEFAEPPPPPPVTNMASFPLESLWTTDPTDELDDGPVGRGAAARPPAGGLEAIFMNREAFEAQEALGLLSTMPPLPPVSRQAREIEVQFGGDIDIDIDTVRTRGGSGGSSGGVVVGRRGADGRFHRVTPPPPQARPPTFESRAADQRPAPPSMPPARTPNYKATAAPSAPLASYRSRGSYISGDD